MPFDNYFDSFTNLLLQIRRDVSRYRPGVTSPGGASRHPHPAPTRLGEDHGQGILLGLGQRTQNSHTTRANLQVTGTVLL